MAYGRYRRKYGRRYKRRRYYKSRYTTLGSARFLAKKALRGIRYIKGLVNSEMYKAEFSLNTVASTSTTTQNLTAIAQGDNDGQRSGNSILLRYIYIRFFLTVHASATNSFVRFLLVCDKQQQGDTTPQLADIIDTTTLDPIMGPLQKTEVGRFSILMDKVFVLDNISRPNVFKKIYMKCYKHIRYNGTASSDIQKNGIFLFIYCNEATNTPTLKLESRVGYHDN